MEIVGGLSQTPVRERCRLNAFHRNALQIALILFPLLIGQAGSLRAALPKIWNEFSGEKAFAHVQRLVDLGPRPAGSNALEKSRVYIEDQLRHAGWQVTRQAFSDNTPRGKIQFVNLIAQFSGAGENAASFVFVVLALRHKNF